MENLMGKIIIENQERIDSSIQIYKINDLEYDDGELISFSADSVGGDMSIQESFDNGFYDRYDILNKQEALKLFELWLDQ